MLVIVVVAGVIVIIVNSLPWLLGSVRSMTHDAWVAPPSKRRQVKMSPNGGGRICVRVLVLSRTSGVSLCARVGARLLRMAAFVCDIDGPQIPRGLPLILFF